jgi:hypothetical protein
MSKATEKFVTKIVNKDYVNITKVLQDSIKEKIDANVFSKVDEIKKGLSNED